jgi:hypothetical protein
LTDVLPAGWRVGPTSPHSEERQRPWHVVAVGIRLSSEFSPGGPITGRHTSQCPTAGCSGTIGIAEESFAEEIQVRALVIASLAFNIVTLALVAVLVTDQHWARSDERVSEMQQAVDRISATLGDPDVGPVLPGQPRVTVSDRLRGLANLVGNPNGHNGGGRFTRELRTGGLSARIDELKDEQSDVGTRIGDLEDSLSGRISGLEDHLGQLLDEDPYEGCLSSGFCQ